MASTKAPAKGFTKGPWTYERLNKRDRIFDREEWYVFADDASEGQKLPAIASSEANARLIAAAPALVEALKAILDRDPYLGDVTFPEARAALRLAGVEE